eukprot:GHVQ01025194.1.p1 GENE.GHVQ01025194.1~~GHVQ01025194.1.p1  ORF type:complete len:408 (-),score=80.60 GHVQ01025194.1:110-1333(-)
MSVSSASRPDFNRFYDGGSQYSDGASVDSFIDRTVHDRQDHAEKVRRKKLADEAAARRRGDGRDVGGPLESIMATLRNCCLPASRGEVGTREDGGRGIFGGVADTTKKDETETVSPLTQHIEGMGNWQRTSTVDDESESADTATMAGEEARKEVEERGEGGGAVDWRIAIDKAAGDSVALSPQQKSWCAVVWALRLENSERMNTRMMAEILAGGAEQKENVDVSLVLKNEKQFYPLDCLRCIEARTIQDILGDLFGLFEEIHGTGAVYGILSKIRVLGIYARKLGETTDIAVFDPKPSAAEKDGPSFVGFKSLDEMEKYVTSLYAKDPDVKRAGSSKFSAWLMRSRILYGQSEFGKSYDKQSPEQAPDWKAEEDARKKDNKYSAKVVYTSLVNATGKSTADENVFSW